VQLDHIVLAVPDLDAAVANFEARTGVAPKPGGSHVGLGTRNALISFGSGHYLELVAPDPAQDIDATFGATLAALPGERLLHWAIATSDLVGIAARAAALGLAPGPIRRTSRATPDGTVLEWRLLGVGGHPLGGLAPFFIDWLDCVHPSTNSPVVGELVECVATLPADAAIGRLIEPAPRGIAIESGAPHFHCRYRTPRGDVVLDADALAGFRI
jgi:hypothetical protein